MQIYNHNQKVQSKLKINVYVYACLYFPSTEELYFKSYCKPNLKQTCIIQKDTDIYLSVFLQIADGSDIPKKKYYEYYFLQDPPIYLQNVRVEMRNSNNKSDIK